MITQYNYAKNKWESFYTEEELKSIVAETINVKLKLAKIKEITLKNMADIQLTRQSDKDILEIISKEEK